MSIEFYGEQSNPNAIVIRREAKVEGIEFFSPGEYSQQLGLMTRPSGYIVPAHNHNLVERTISQTQEVLLLRRGKCKVLLYSNELTLQNSIILNEGDTILLAHGPHKIEMLTECEILEVKQGPYAGANDKTLVTPKE